MADQLIQEIISEQAFKDVERLQELMAGTLKQFEDSTVSVKEFDAALRSAKSIPELNKAIADNLKLEKDMIRQEQELEKLNKQKIVTEQTIEKLKQSQIKTDSDTIKLQQLKNKESEKSAKQARDEADAYVQLKKQYNEVANEAKKLSAEYGINNEQAVKASQKAKQLSDALFQIESAVGQHQRNVGNYAGSARIIVEALERQKQKVVQVGRSFGEMSPEAAAARHELESLQRITDNPQFLNIASKVGDTNKELRFFTQRLNELEDAGLKNSGVYKEVRTRLAQLTDQIGDTKAEVKALSSDTRGFDLFAGAVKTLAAGWQTAAGAAELFGVKNEDVQKSIQRLVAIQSVANGVQQLATEFTTRGSAANKVFAFTQGLLAKAFDTSASAASRFKAALGILGLIATVIGAIVLAYNAFSKSTQEVITRQKLLNDITRDAADNYGKEKVQLDSLVGVIQREGATRKQKFEALKELRRTIPDTSIT
jgi:myosin heavy subunit